MMSANATPASQPACSVTPESPNPIPVEILSRIISQLSTPELGRSARSSRLFYLIATPILYRTVHIDISLPSNPIFINGVPIPKFSWETTEPTTITQPPIDDLMNLLSLEPAPPPLIPIHDRLLYTTHLTLRAHRRDQCSGLLPGLLAMPKLQSLRVLANAGDHRLDLCTSVDEMPSPLDPEPGCPMAHGLHPRKITLGGFDTGLSGSARGLHMPSPPISQFDPPFPIITCSFPPPTVKELVIQVGMLRGVFYGVDMEPTALFLQELPASLDMVTFMLSTSPEDHTSNPWCNLRDHVVSRTLDKLAEACSGDAQVVEVADYEIAEKYWLAYGENEMIFKSFSAYLRPEIAWRLTMKGWSTSTAQRKSKELRFVSGEEWRARLDEDVEAE